MKHKFIKESFYPPKKNILGIIGNAIGGALGFMGQQSANRANLQIARETNEANRQLMREQNEWNKQMYYENNEYNSPAAQRQRLKVAGINPLSAGIANAPATAPTSASAQAVTSAPMQNEFQPFQNGIMNAVQSQVLEAQTDLMRSEAEKNRSTLPKTAEETRGLKLANDVRAWSLNWEKQANGANFRNQFESSSLMAEMSHLYFDVVSGNGDVSQAAQNTIQEAFMSVFEKQITEASNEVLKGKNLEADTEQKFEQAKNYAQQILLGYAGLANNIEVANIKAAVDKLAANLNFQVGMAGVDKTVSGFIIDIIKKCGLTPENVGKVVTKGIIPSLVDLFIH